MDISVRTNALKDKNGSTIAVANVKFGDQFNIKNITVKDSKNGRFVSMPSYATNKSDEKGNIIYQDVFNPITANGREKLFNAVLESLDSGKEVIIKDETSRDGSDITARVVPFDESRGGVVGLGRLYLNEEFVVNNIAVRESKEGGLFVSFPSYKTNEVDEKGKAVYKDFAYPADKNSRDKITGIVMDAYKESKEISKVPMQKEEVLKDEKPKGIKAKLKEGEEKSKKATSKTPKAPAKAKQAAIE